MPLSDGSVAATVAAVLPDDIAALILRQDGVATRAQLLAVGAMPHDLERWRRRRELVMVHPRVYVDHTGEPTARQLAWAAVLACGRAALWGETAVRAYEGTFAPVGGHPLLVAVDVTRRVQPPEGVRVRRVGSLEDRVQWHRRPPCQRYDHAVIEVVTGRDSRISRTEAIGLLAAALQQRRTTADRLHAALAARSQARERDWLTGVLRDLGTGSCSVLELAYATDVERAHGLPASVRQRRSRSRLGVVYRDHEYDDGVVVELDGRLFHDSAGQRDRDLERDLDAALDGLETLRLGWAQVTDRSCATAGKVARLLARRGWTGRPRPCGPACPAIETFREGAI